MNTLPELITQELAEHGFHDVEGNSHQIIPQVHALYYLSKPPVTSILEIGFNAGHSSDTFLQHPAARVVSFDLGARPYVSLAKQRMDRIYPGRHTLVLGDSTVTLPQWISENPNTTFDVIFIDGGHEEVTVRSDMKHSLLLSHSETLLLMDDVIYNDGWEAEYTIGPTAVWKEYVAAGRIQELGHYDYAPGRGMSWGRVRISMEKDSFP